jgi:RND family efflux transporter MFP subunit
MLTLRHFLTIRAYKWLGWLLLATVILIFTIAMARRATHAPSTALAASHAIASPQPLSVVTQELAQAGPTQLVQQFTGVVAARRTTQLSAKTLSRVEHLAVDIGDSVAEGQVLVELDMAELQATRDVTAFELSAAQARLAELKQGPRAQEIEQAESRVDELQAQVALRKANLARAEMLKDSQSISQQEYDESRYASDAILSQLASARQTLDLLREGTRSEQLAAQQATVQSLSAQLERLEVQLDDKQIAAPYRGQIQARFVDEGRIVSPGQPLLEVVELEHQEIHVGLPPKLADEAAGISFSIKLDELELPASIVRIAPSIDASTHTREVRLRIADNYYRTLPVGSAVTVELDSPVTSQGYWLPTSALTAGPRGLWVLYVAVAQSEPTADGETTYLIAARPVELLRAQGDWAEVAGALNASELVVIDGTHRVVPGQQVIPVQQLSQPTNPGQRTTGSEATSL